MTRSAIAALVYRYEANISNYRQPTYNETETRGEFIDPFLAAFGWDVYNERNVSYRFREVRREQTLPGGEKKRPDYELRLGTERKIFIEVKKPSVNILESTSTAFQVRSYGWTAGLKVSILTNFEYLLIYDTTVEPAPEHAANHARLFTFHYSQYLDEYDRIMQMLSRNAVYRGQFDDYFITATASRLTENVDRVFLQRLNQWRVEISRDILSKRPDISEGVLNEVTQRLILRIIFLRMCEDRGIRTYEELRNTVRTNNWDDFVGLLLALDARFDAGLFDTTDDPFCHPQEVGIRLDTRTIQRIIETLYYPQSPYTFAVIEPEFLGSVYEDFLKERIIIVENEPILVAKPENVDRDIVATPRTLIDEVVQNTLYNKISALTDIQLLSKRLLDLACGSAGFLLAAFDLLLDRLITYYMEQGDIHAIYETTEGWRLTYEKKCEVLTRCIYGVDRDHAAVEVARFSLWVKLLENETEASLPEGNAVLPLLHQNIVYGDSLIDQRIYAVDVETNPIGPPVVWGEQLPAQYDFIVGNPPYLKTEDIVNLEPVEHRFYLQFYETPHQQFDKYYLFLERAVKDLLKVGGSLGMVVSRKFTHIEAGKKLRSFLSRNARIDEIVDFGNAQLFEGRTTYVCLLYLTKPQPREDEPSDLLYELVSTPIEWIQRLSNPSPMTLPRRWVSGQKAWILPNTPQELALIEALLSDYVPLGDVAHVFNGIQTSRNDVYVISEWEEVDEATIRFVKDQVVWEIERSLLKPFFDGRYGELKSFYPLPQTALVIYPYVIFVEDDTYHAMVVPPADLRSLYPLTYRWLKNNEELLKQRDIRPQPYPKEEWYRYGRDQALTAFEDRPKIVVGVNSLGDKYVYDDTNTLLASGGTAGECAIATYRDDPERSPYNLHFILGVLNHKAIEYFCRKRGSPFRGGWYARGTAVLREVPLPKIDFDTDNAKRSLYFSITQLSQQLCNIGRDLTQKNSRAQHEALTRRASLLKQKMDAQIARLYQITDIINEVNLP
jgi:type I restriction-modification system DNA methylase subunit/predicted type IV restriction endonuclease